MDHAVGGFASLTEENISTILAMSSMQFGDLGRGLKGNGIFVLESLDAFYDRIEEVASECETENAKVSIRIGPSPDDPWFRRIAKTVKERLERRKTGPWCGHCGASAGGGGLPRCSVCRDAYHCDVAHQNAAWPFHKHFCGKTT